MKLSYKKVEAEQNVLLLRAMACCILWTQQFHLMDNSLYIYHHGIILLITPCHLLWLRSTMWLFAGGQRIHFSFHNVKACQKYSGNIFSTNKYNPYQKPLFSPNIKQKRKIFQVICYIVQKKYNLTSAKLQQKTFATQKL